MRRPIAAVLAVLDRCLNGLMMLLAGAAWYASVPGVSETGPYNPHFIQDIGAAFLVAGLRACRTRLAAPVLARGGCRRRLPGTPTPCFISR